MTQSIDRDTSGTPPDGVLPSVTVILIVRNGAAFIAQALESVFQSRLKPVEILVIDGGSTDGTAQIAGQFPLTRVVPQDSGGIPNAYNLGIGLAQGELIAFISHDDLWQPGKLDRQVELMRQNPELQFTVAMVEHFLEPGMAVPPGFRRELLEQPVAGFIMEALVARKAVFDTVGRFDPSFKVGEDTDWFARAKDMGVAHAVLSDVVVRKRVHDANSSLNTANINALLLRAMRNSVKRKRQAGSG
jgi:glycosyltransferase involved in cell wall biosynthesis